MLDYLKSFFTGKLKFIRPICLSRKRVRCVATPILLILILIGDVSAEDSASSLSGVSLQLDSARGSYGLLVNRLNWVFAGNLPGPIADVKTTHGEDAIGTYEQSNFSWNEMQAPLTGYIRIYRDGQLVLFSQTCRTAMEIPPQPFPDFTNVPSGLHVFSHGLKTFAPPQFTASASSTPWLLFDDSANACIISPASHFMVASMAGDGKSRVASGFNQNLRDLPAGFTQSTLVAFGPGINRTWQSWGRALLLL